MQGKTLLDRYRIGDPIGRGGRGVVYRARDLLLDREVAIKIILPKIMTADSRERFRREARTAASLDHPAIAPIYDFGQHGEELFIVMPLLPGQTLRILIESRKLDPRKTIEISIQVADALVYSHSQGVIHRDIKPENIMVEWHRLRLPLVKVLDFGLATHIDDQLRREAASAASQRPDSPHGKSGEVIFEGTPLYVSPEQLLGEESDPRSDLYALGMVLYECLAGEHPLRDGTGSILKRVLLELPGSLRARGVRISESLERLIMSCLAKAKEDRPKNAREALRSLVDARQALEPVPDPTPPEISTAPSSSRAEDRSRSESASPLSDEEPSLADRLGDLLLVQGEYLEAQEAYRKARETQRSADGLLSPRIETHYLLKLARLASQLGRYQEALDRCRHGLEIVGTSNRLRAAELMALAGLVCCMGGRYYESENWLAQGRECLGKSTRSEADVLPVQVMLLRTEGNLLMGRSQPARAVDVFWRALAMTERLDDRWERSIGLFNVGEALLEAGDEPAAVDYLLRAVNEKSAIGDRWGLAYARHAVARLRLRQGDLDSAREEAQNGLRLADEIENPKIASRLRALLGRVHLEQADVRRAQEYFQAALKDAERIASEPDIELARRGLEATRDGSDRDQPKWVDFSDSSTSTGGDP